MVEIEVVFLQGGIHWRRYEERLIRGGMTGTGLLFFMTGVQRWHTPFTPVSKVNARKSGMRFVWNASRGMVRKLMFLFFKKEIETV